MVEKSIVARMFEAVIFFSPASTDPLVTLAALRKVTGRRIFISWNYYNQYAMHHTKGKDVKITMTGFITCHARGFGHWLYNATGLAPLVCKHRGHKLTDCSSAGPDSGDMDYCCDRCDHQWSVPLY